MDRHLTGQGEVAAVASAWWLGLGLGRPPPLLDHRV